MLGITGCPKDDKKCGKRGAETGVGISAEFEASGLGGERHRIVVLRVGRKQGVEEIRKREHEEKTNERRKQNAEEKGERRRKQSVEEKDNINNKTIYY